MTFTIRKEHLNAFEDSTMVSAKPTSTGLPGTPRDRGSSKGVCLLTSLQRPQMPLQYTWFPSTQISPITMMNILLVITIIITWFPYSCLWLYRVLSLPPFLENYLRINYVALTPFLISSYYLMPVSVPQAHISVWLHFVTCWLLVNYPFMHWPWGIVSIAELFIIITLVDTSLSSALGKLTLN